MLWANAVSHAQSPSALEALREMESKNWSKAQRLVKIAKDPMLAKLYYWNLFQSDDSRAHFDRMSSFIRSNPDWPAIYDMRQQLEHNITAEVSSSELIEWFVDYPPITADGLDHYAYALLQARQSSTLKKVMDDWWAKTLMSRDDQIRIYGKYKSFISLDSHRRRLDRLLFNKQYSNARAVARVLGRGYPDLAEARIALAAQKSGVDLLIKSVPAHLQNDPGLVYERLRWRRKKDLDMRAMEILFNPPQATKIINAKDWWRERHILIRRMLEKGRYETAYMLAEKHFQTQGFAYAQAEWLTGWLALRFMNNPAEALKRFEALDRYVKTPVSKARATYWAGKASEALGQAEVSANWFAKASQYQTVFYGQQAGLRTNINEALRNAAPPKLTQSDIKRFRQNQLIQAAKLYNAVDIDDRVSEFLWAFTKSEDTPKAYLFAAELAGEMKRYSDVIGIAKEATRKGLFLTLQSYPEATKSMKYANDNVEHALIHALIRQESQFNPNAESPVGALGLMQLMPGTARAVARKHRFGHQTRWLTEKPQHNIRLGSYYIAELLKKYDGDYVLATAAYNAGPGRVDRWLKQYGDPRTGDVNRIDWIELIPIYETRNYVQRVMEGLYVYRLTMKENNLKDLRASLN